LDSQSPKTQTPNTVKKAKTSWLQAGYTRFGLGGTAALQVEQLAWVVGKSKSSFYHHFGSSEVFLEALFELHRERVIEIAQKENEARNLDPDLVAILAANTEDLLFSRFLRILRAQPGFEELIHLSDQKTGPGFLLLWQKESGFSFSQTQILSFIQLAMDHFYLQTTTETLNQDWLTNYIRQIRSQLQQLSQRPLDGSV
jgi:AcrR family transcriptional regulator